MDDVREEMVVGADVAVVDVTENAFTLSHVPDELLLLICGKLDSGTLRMLMSVSHRFETIISNEKSLWRDVDFSKEPLPFGCIQHMMEYTNKETRNMKLRGPPACHHHGCEAKIFSKALKYTFRNRCVNLKQLELEGVAIDFLELSTSDFPSSLLRLVLKDCTANANYFTGLNRYLTNLQELEIVDIEWFMPAHLTMISHMPNLRWLSLKGCQFKRGLSMNYEITPGFSFKNLEYLDFRGTNITDFDLRRFTDIATLKQLLLEGPESRSNVPYETISDCSICCFGDPPIPIIQIFIMAHNRLIENQFERLILRNYDLVTNLSLKHLVQCSPRLTFIDLSGTSVSYEGVMDFKEQKPHCLVIAEHIVELEEEPREAVVEEPVN